MTSPRLLSVLAVAALVPGLAACGNKHARIDRAETEGVYVDVGNLKYQVQISRELNPAISEDRTFLSGLAPGDLVLAPDETWFAIFVRIENEHPTPQPPATEFAIEDTVGTEYKPLPIGRDNPFHYVRADVPPNGVLPDPDSVAWQTSVRGLELLFKLKRTSLDDRPLVLKIHSPTDPSAVSEVDLDV